MTQDYLSRLFEYYKKYNKTSIFEGFFNITIHEVEEGKSIHKIQTTENHANRQGYVHGGALSTICDMAMGTACMTVGKKVVTVDMTISYLKPTHIDRRLTAVGKVVSQGSTIVHTTGEIFDEEGQLLVRSQGTYYITGDFKIEDQ